VSEIVPDAATAASDAAVAFPWAASRIVDLSPSSIERDRRGEILTLEPNLNVLSPSAILPILRGVVEAGTTVLSCAVRAGDEQPTLTEKPPMVEYGNGGTIRVIDGNGSVAASFV
jgi:hypothetical protein